MAGQYVLAQDYIRALRVRRLIIEAINAAMADVDVLAMPTLPVPAVRIADVAGPETTIIMVRNTQPFNQSGHPAITLPVGTTAEGTPIGFQLVADAFADYELLSIAELVEGIVGFDPTPPVLRDALV